MPNVPDTLYKNKSFEQFRVFYHAEDAVFQFIFVPLPTNVGFLLCNKANQATLVALGSKSIISQKTRNL